jgi:hypothetical protein
LRAVIIRLHFIYGRRGKIIKLFRYQRSIRA